MKVDTLFKIQKLNNIVETSEEKIFIIWTLNAIVQT